jgi:hypothetical protein
MVRHEVACIAVVRSNDSTWCSLAYWPPVPAAQVQAGQAATSTLLARALLVTAGCEAARTKPSRPKARERKLLPLAPTVKIAG